mmetsp:Transcript_35680/g.63497  ORF Transcript_35680/g.63497 Transcript_35680/m.63497 type:complete len:637 (-) Transcript_35680:168-2078(-)
MSSAMHQIAVLLVVCLTDTVHGRRIRSFLGLDSYGYVESEKAFKLVDATLNLRPHAPAYESARSLGQPLAALRKLFLALDPSASFSPAGSRPVLVNKEHRCARSSLALSMGTDGASVLFVVPSSSSPSLFGATSPVPSPEWLEVATHLSSRLPGFDDRIHSSVITDEELADTSSAEALKSHDIVLALGLKDSFAQQLSKLAEGSSTSALLCHACADEVAALQRVGAYCKGAAGLEGTLQGLQASLAPWGAVAQGRRLSEQADLLLSRQSSEDLLYTLFFVLHAYKLDIPLVRYTVNPTWEKGPLRNAQEFATMVQKCTEPIAAAMTDPETKATIDLLNACDMRDQVGSYRVIVSYETPQLEDFSLCILQKNNVFGCDAPIVENPRVPLLAQWRGTPLDDKASRQIFIGHFDCDESHPVASQRKAWRWKIVTGANPAYDAFPAQHQIFYPSKKSKTALWYDPVFKVETLDGRQIWTKRHYRCTPRQVAPDLRQEDGTSAGAWTLTTLDNGVLSREHWTIVDAADDLSWAIFHYSGAASVVGQSYLGALLCSADGQWPESARTGDELERIKAAFRKCGIEFWELYGHGPPESGKSFMWSPDHVAWEANNPPPLEIIGDQSVQAWRASEKEKDAAAAVR